MAFLIGGSYTLVSVCRMDALYCFCFCAQCWETYCDVDYVGEVKWPKWKKLSHLSVYREIVDNAIVHRCMRYCCVARRCVIQC